MSRKQHQKNLIREIETLLRTKVRNIADNTKSRLLGIQERIANYLMHGDGKYNPGLQSIRSLKPHHVASYVNFVRDEWFSRTGKELKPGSLANHLTTFRDIAKGIGKQNIVKRDNADYLANRGERNNPVIMDVDNYNNALVKLATKHHGAWATIAKVTGDTIGLRRREQLLTKDVIVKLADGTILVSHNASLAMKEITTDGLKVRYKAAFGQYLKNMVPGQLYAIIEGAKTGQRRICPLDTESKTTAMELRMAYIRDVGHKSIMPSAKTQEQAINAYKNALQRSGFTKDNGCHPHAARHYFVQQELAAGTNRWELSEMLGHHRRSCIDFYAPKK